MRHQTFERSEIVPLPVDRVFAFHADSANIVRVMPPTTRIVSIDCPSRASEGAEFTVEAREFGLIPLRWRGIWERVEPPGVLVDRMVDGPFAFWRHEHRFVAVDESSTRLTDHVEFSLGGSAPAILAGIVLARIYFPALFHFRHRRTLHWARQAAAAAPSPAES